MTISCTVGSVPVHMWELSGNQASLPECGEFGAGLVLPQRERKRRFSHEVRLWVWVENAEDLYSFSVGGIPLLGLPGV